MRMQLSSRPPHADGRDVDIIQTVRDVYTPARQEARLPHLVVLDWVLPREARGAVAVVALVGGGGQLAVRRLEVLALVHRLQHACSRYV